MNCNRERGAMLVLLLLLIPILLVFLAFAVDIGWVIFHRHDAQRSVDAAALSGAAGVPFYNLHLSEDTLRAQRSESLAQMFNGSDPSTGANLIVKLDPQIEPTHMTFIKVVNEAPVPVSPTEYADGLRVTRQLEVPLMFGRFIGMQSVPVEVTATAVIGSPSCFPVRIPMAVIHSQSDSSRSFCSAIDCTKVITVDLQTVPEMDENASWFAYPNRSEDPKAGNGGITPDAKTCRERVRGEREGDMVCVGEVVRLNNGAVESCRQEVYNQCQTRYQCTEESPWVVTVPIIFREDISGGSGPSDQRAPVRGFTRIGLTQVVHQPSQKTMRFKLVCNGMVIGMPGGGAACNFYGAPSLIQ